MGRITALPATDTAVGGTGSVALSYYADGMVRSENDGTNTDTFNLDPAGRILSQGSSATGLTTTNIYADPGDSASSIVGSDGSSTTNYTDIAGNLAAIRTHYHQSAEAPRADSVALQIVNPHGDVIATLTDPPTGTPSMTAYFESTEFGVPRAADTTHPANYGWLGGKRRDSGGLAGLVSMGERVYDPYLGRFTTVDPVSGGSANDYDYCNQDPVNSFDLDGTSVVGDSGGGLSGTAPRPIHHRRAKAVWKQTTPIMQLQDKYDVIGPWRDSSEKEAEGDSCPGCDVILELAFNQRHQTREAVEFQEETWTECNQYHECRSGYSSVRTIYEEERTLVFFYPKWQWRILGHSDNEYKVVSSDGGLWHSRPWRV